MNDNDTNDPSRMSAGPERPVNGKPPEDPSDPASRVEKAARVAKYVAKRYGPVAVKYGPTIAILILRRYGKNRLAVGIGVASFVHGAVSEIRKAAKQNADDEEKKEDDDGTV